MDMSDVRKIVKQASGMHVAIVKHQSSVVAYRDDESGRLIALKVPCVRIIPKRTPA